MYLSILCFCAACLCAACGPSDSSRPASAVDYDDLVGFWAMNQVFEDTTDVTMQHNPGLNRWIELNADGSFGSGGAPYGYNSGVWTFDPGDVQLYLDSDAGEEDDSYWYVDVDSTSMTWRGVGSEYAERFRIVFSRQ